MNVKKGRIKGLIRSWWVHMLLFLLTGYVAFHQSIGEGIGLIGEFLAIVGVWMLIRTINKKKSFWLSSENGRKKPIFLSCSWIIVMQIVAVLGFGISNHAGVFSGDRASVSAQGLTDDQISSLLSQSQYENNAKNFEMLAQKMQSENEYNQSEQNADQALSLNPGSQSAHETLLIDQLAGGISNSEEPTSVLDQAVASYSQTFFPSPEAPNWATLGYINTLMLNDQESFSSQTKMAYAESAQYDYEMADNLSPDLKPYEGQLQAITEWIQQHQN